MTIKIRVGPFFGVAPYPSRETPGPFHEKILRSEENAGGNLKSAGLEQRQVDCALLESYGIW